MGHYTSPWHIDPVIALFSKRSFELIAGFDECNGPKSWQLLVPGFP